MTLRELALHAVHEGRGAVFSKDGSGFRLPLHHLPLHHLPLHYGDAQAELRSLRTASGVVDLSHRSRLELVGADRARFLQGQITCDVQSLEPGQGAFGFMTNGRGRVMTTVVVRALEDRLWMELPPGLGRPIQEHLEKYIVMDRVEVRRLDELLPIAILGETVPTVVAELAAGSLPDVFAQPWSHARVELDGSQVHLTRHERLGAPGFVAWISEGIADLVVAGWLDETDLDLVGFEAFETLRVLSGVAAWGHDFDERNLPQETSIEGAIDWDKGCYLGQEIVARLHYRGQAARQLRCLSLGAAPADPLADGSTSTELFFEDRAVGALTSWSPLSVDGRHPAIAMLQRRALDPGTVLRFENGSEVAVLEAGLS